MIRFATPSSRRPGQPCDSGAASAEAALSLPLPATHLRIATFSVLSGRDEDTDRRVLQVGVTPRAAVRPGLNQSRAGETLGETCAFLESWAGLPVRPCLVPRASESEAKLGNDGHVG